MHFRRSFLPPLAECRLILLFQLKYVIRITGFHCIARNQKESTSGKSICSLSAVRDNSAIIIVKDTGQQHKVGLILTLVLIVRPELLAR